MTAASPYFVSNLNLLYVIFDHKDILDLHTETFTCNTLDEPQTIIPYKYFFYFTALHDADKKVLTTSI